MVASSPTSEPAIAAHGLHESGRPAQVGGLGETGNDRASFTAGPGRRFGVVDNRDDIVQFLPSRRARITPEQAGLPDFGGSRRVAGLRRAEVAMIAGVSPDYY